VHTPDEHISVTSVEHVWRLLLEVLDKLEV
jgi:di/tripeptidase